jgi:DNA-3-methyladenine glycosylase
VPVPPPGVQPVVSGVGRRGGSATGQTTLHPPPLLAGFFDRAAEQVARDLLGAYTGPEDPAGYAAEAIGPTARNDPLFGPPGTTYIHMNYGIHWLLNAVVRAEGEPAGVLIRALEPTEGAEVMRSRRGRLELTNGPARLAEALGVGPELQRHWLDRPPLWVSRGEPVPEGRVVVTTRIGISKGTEQPLRFYDGQSDWVSRR